MGPSITDPTIFDNLRVVVEGALYERDLAGELAVVERRDLVDLAAFSRCFRMKVRMPSSEASALEPIQMELRLSSQFVDFAAEKAAALWEGLPPLTPGCKLEASLRIPVATAAQSAKVTELRPEHLHLGEIREMGRAVERFTAEIWQEKHTRPELQLRFHGALSSPSAGALELEAVIRFTRQLDEDDAAAIPDRIEECLALLERIQERMG